jgi:chemotaxis protein MotB
VGGKKQKHEEHENHERWLVSYADFITLLFATFTALYAISSADLAKFKKFGESVKDSFSQQSIMSESLINGIKSILQGKSPPNDNPNPLSSKKGEGDGVLGKFTSMVNRPGQVKGKGASAKHPHGSKAKRNAVALDQLTQAVALLNNQLKVVVAKTQLHQMPLQDIQVLAEPQGIRLRLDSRLLFDSGSAQLRPEARAALSVIGARLRALAVVDRLRVEGHTDNQPMSSSQFPSNWELSAARAASVVRYLIVQQQFLSERFSVVGYADSQPVVPNTTAEGRAKNRRIDIAVTLDTQEDTPVKPLDALAPPSPAASPTAHPHPQASPTAPAKPRGPSPPGQQSPVGQGHPTGGAGGTPSGFVAPRFERILPEKAASSPAPTKKQERHEASQETKPGH